MSPPSRPVLYDLFCGAGGCTRGYQDAGFYVVGVDLAPQPHYVGDAFVQQNAFLFLADVLKGRRPRPDAWHASPPCQGYSIMRNLPWLREKKYPLLIAPTRNALRRIGGLYVLENVMGATTHPKGINGAGYLCGAMFGRRFYRHRAFETNWLWLAPPHRQHRIVMHPARRNLDDLPPEGDKPRFQDNKGSYRYQRGSRGIGVCPDPDAGIADGPPPGVIHAGRFLGPRARQIVFSAAEDARGSLTAWQSAAARNGMPCGVGHTAGFREARAEMGCEWMTRDELTQAIPPVYTAFIGQQLRRALGLPERAAEEGA